MNTKAELIKANRRAAFFWGGLVVAFLSLQVCLGGFAIYLSKSDPSVAIIPDYYQRAVKSDETKQLRADSEALQWEIDCTADVESGILINVRDSLAHAVSLQSAVVRFFRHARANDIFERSNFSENDLINGHVAIREPLHHRGLWQIELDLTCKDGRRYIESLEIEIGDVRDSELAISHEFGHSHAGTNSDRRIALGEEDVIDSRKTFSNVPLRRSRG